MLLAIFGLVSAASCTCHESRLDLYRVDHIMWRVSICAVRLYHADLQEPCR